MSEKWYAIAEQTGIFLCLILAFASQLSIAVTSIAMAMGGILFLLLLQAKRTVLSESEKNVFYGMVIFFGCLFISNLFSLDVMKSQEMLVAHALRWIPFFLPIVFIRTKKQWLMVVSMLLLSTLVADVWGIYQRGSGMARAIGFERNPIYFAAEILIVLFFGLVLLIYEKNRYCRILSGIVVFASCIAILVSGTRGAWISFCVGIAFFAWFGRKKLKEKFKWQYLLVIPVIVIVVGLAMPELVGRILSIVSFSNTSNLERIYLWQSSLNMFLDHPFVGVGMGQFNPVYIHGYINEKAIYPNLVHSHNSLLTFLSENGILGGLGFSCLFGSVLWTARKEETHSSIWMKACIIETIVFLVGSMTDHLFTVLILMRLYWLSIGIFFVAHRLRL